MQMPLSLVGFAGSLRRNSVNQGLLRAAQALLGEHAHLEILPLGALPYYDQDLEPDEPQSIRDLKAHIQQADGVLIATPEFNASVPGVLKNVLDWLSRPPGSSVMAGKPTAIVGAGGGGGTAQAQTHLRQILARMRVPVQNEPHVQIARSWEKFDARGNLQHEESRERLRSLLSTWVGAIHAQIARHTPSSSGHACEDRRRAQTACST